MLFVTDAWNDAVYRSMRNIPGVDVIESRNMNAYGMLRAEVLLITKEGLSSLEGVFAQMKDLTKIILKPVITERSNEVKEADNKFVFEVHPEANKREIKLAVEKLFNVTVKDVKTAVMRGKPKTTTDEGRTVRREAPRSEEGVRQARRGAEHTTFSTRFEVSERGTDRWLSRSSNR